jgi:glycosyltransferase involved in cell wall biosynthesis
VRILVLSDLYPPATRGGYEVECHDVVEHLRAQGHEVVVLTSRWRAGEVAAEAHVLRRLPWTGEGSRRETLTAPLASAQGTRVARRALAEVAPEVIYVWNGGGVPATALRTLQLHPAPMLVRVCEYWFGHVYSNDQFTRHLHQTRPGLPGAWDHAMRLAARLPLLRVDPWDPRPAAVCWNSAFVRDRAPAPPAFDVVHGEVVFPSNARMDELDGVPRDPVAGRVLFVGRLDEHKGARTLVAALGLLERDHGVRAELHAVGDGPADERETLRRLAAEAGVADRVTFTGPLRGAPLLAEIAAASAWSVPSVWDEPAGLTCIEAALSRVPAVLSRVGGIPEMFEDERHALFHERGDAAGLAAALARTLAGGEEVAARVERAHARGRELSFGPYLAAMDRFFEAGLAALRAR